MAELELHRAGSGEPLVLIHGIGSCWQVWEPVLPALEARYDVLALSLPGYGLSPPLAERPTVTALVDAVERALDSAGFETAHVAGNSLGGWLAAELAVRGRARSVAAFAPAGLATGKEYRYTSAVLRAAYAVAKPLAPGADRIARSALGRQLLFGPFCIHPERISPDSAAHQARVFSRAPSFIETLDSMREQIPGRLESIACPFVIVWGTRDLVLPYRQAARWERIVPGAELITLPGAGHVPMVDEPEQSLRAISQATAAATAKAPERV